MTTRRSFMGAIVAALGGLLGLAWPAKAASVIMLDEPVCKSREAILEWWERNKKQIDEDGWEVCSKTEPMQTIYSLKGWDVESVSGQNTESGSLCIYTVRLIKSTTLG